MKRKKGQPYPIHPTLVGQKRATAKCHQSSAGRYRWWSWKTHHQFHTPFQQGNRSCCCCCCCETKMNMYDDDPPTDGMSGSLGAGKNLINSHMSKLNSSQHIYLISNIRMVPGPCWNPGWGALATTAAAVATGAKYLVMPEPRRAPGMLCWCMSCLVVFFGWGLEQAVWWWQHLGDDYGSPDDPRRSANPAPSSKPKARSPSNYISHDNYNITLCLCFLLIIAHKATHREGRREFPISLSLSLSRWFDDISQCGRNLHLIDVSTGVSNCGSACKFD